MTTPEACGVELEWGVRIPLRDGTQLNATVYRPKNPRKAAPCVATLTPYVADRCHLRGMYFAAQGFPFAVVDVRGRGNSAGVFRPYLQESVDGHDVVEWLASQPYCNGKVALWGGSYSGYAQWVVAAQRPPHLATIAPTAAPHMGTDFPMRGNIFYPYLMQWIAFTSGRASQEKLFADVGFWSRQFQAWFASGRPFRDLDGLLGIPSALFQEWLTHPEADAYWDSYNPSPGQYASLELPVLTITGSYDDDQLGALEHYQRHMRHGSPKARAQHHLVIGPWDHQGTSTPRAQFGGLSFGPASLLDIPRLHVEWYAWTMLGGPKPKFLEKRVAYYVMGAERWRYADALEEITARYETYYLDSTSNATDVFSSGSLAAACGRGPPDVYTYDPRDASGTEVQAEGASDGGSLVDQRLTLALRGRQLVYHSAPFATDTQLSGFFKLSAWIAIDCPDSDFYVSVHEIGLDGGSIRLSMDALRARYRQGLHVPRLIETRAPLRYDFERFMFVSRLIRRGHRLRLIIAPMGRLIDAPFSEKNFNGGGDVAAESAREGRAVTVRLFHDTEHPSALHVPLGRAEG